MNLQPFFSWFLGEGWSVGYSGNILANWKASSNNVWTVPIGVAVGKVLKLGKLSVKIQLAGQYMPIRPDNVGAGVEHSVPADADHSEAHQGAALPVMRSELSERNPDR